MIKLFEPSRGIALSKSLFAWMQASVFWAQWMPILADVFVFTYPVYLVALYLYGLIAKKLQYKKAAIFIFCGTVSSVLINIIIQFIVDKSRPNIVL